MADQLDAVPSYRKLKLENPLTWDHHRGGWKYAIQLIQEELHCDDGTLMISSVEDVVFEEKVITEPWVGFVHQVENNGLEWFPDLERLVTDKFFLQSLPLCRGLLTLSSTVKSYLQRHVANVPVTMLFYPATPGGKEFQLDRYLSHPRQVLFVGEFMRNFQSFFDLSLPNSGQYEKILLKPADVDFEELKIKENDSVKVLEYIQDSDYDEYLSNSVVFLNLFDAPANTTVIECITRNNPIIVNRLPGLEEYLGKEYPLFYDDVTEASELLQSETKLRDGFDYLKNMDKSFLDGKSFLRALQNSAIYRTLPLPTSQETGPKKFQAYDMSVVICSYKRVYNMERILQCFAEQNCTQTFEVIIWNNNYEKRDELQEICNKFQSTLNLKVIHSTENYYCIIRLAMGSLMRSDVMVICDDDVIPSESFLSEYLSKYQQYGPDTVLCCRGHRFFTHALNEENPEECWVDYENLRFFDETKEDMKVHFLHADTCLFPKHLLTKVAEYPLPSYDTILVDDYWLSYVLSHLLHVPIWKIQGTNLFRSTPCAEDSNIALFLNPKVREERIKFYIYHMRKGWPNSAIESGR